MSAAPAFPTIRIVFALIMREMTTRYTRVAGGYLWAILEPVAAITLLSILFSQAFRAPPLGASFALFYASAYLPLMLYSDLAEKTGTAVAFSRQLLFYPAVTLADALLARFTLNLLTHLLVICIVISALILGLDTRARPSLSELMLAISMAAALGLGIGAFNCFLFGVLPIWQRIWSVFNKPLFLLSCLFYTFGSIPLQFRDILWFNPLVHVVGQFRAGLYPSYDAACVSPAYVFALALVGLCAGMVLLGRFKSRILNDG